MMTIHLPEEVERSIEAAVGRGLFASLDDAMTNAANLLLRQLEQEQPAPRESEPAAGPPAPIQRKPIWERAAELRETIPAEEWAKLPIDGASQHDHYIYGTPKRPTR